MQSVLDATGLDWTVSTLVFFLSLALLAEILGTIGGFGSSVFFVPVATAFMGIHEALGLTALFHVASNISKIALFRQGVDRRIILLLGVPAVLAVILGAWLTLFIETGDLEIFLGVLLIVLSIFFLRYPKHKIQDSSRNVIAGGLVSGGLAGLLGTGGAIRGLTLSAFGMPKEIFIATSAVIDLGVDASRAIVYTGNGFVGTSTLSLLPFMIVIGFIGTYVGKRILEHIPQARFKKIVLLLIFGIGLSMVLIKSSVIG